MATAMAAPVAALAYLAMVTNASQPVLSPKVWKMVPMSNEANKPKAIAPSASTK